MSMDRCTNCERPVDTDEDTECYASIDDAGREVTAKKCRCENCREKQMPVKLINGLDEAIADFSWVKADTVRDDILIDASEVRAFLEAGRFYQAIQQAAAPKAEEED